MSDPQSIYERIMQRAQAPVVEVDTIDLAVPPRDGNSSGTYDESHAGERIAAMQPLAKDMKMIDDTEERYPGTNRWPMMKWLLTGAAALGVLVAGVAAGVLVQRGVVDLSGPANAADRSRSATQDKDLAPRAPTPFDEHITKATLAQCKDVFPLLGLAATSGSTFSASSSWSGTQPSAHAIQSLVGLGFDSQSFKGNGASVVYSAPVGDKCEGMFVRVVPVSQDCSAFAMTLPKDSKVNADLSGVSLLTLPSGWQTMLVPSGANSCIVVTTARAAG